MATTEEPYSSTWRDGSWSGDPSYYNNSSSQGWTNSYSYEKYAAATEHTGSTDEIVQESKPADHSDATTGNYTSGNYYTYSDSKDNYQSYNSYDSSGQDSYSNGYGSNNYGSNSYSYWNNDSGQQYQYDPSYSSNSYANYNYSSGYDGHNKLSGQSSPDAEQKPYETNIAKGESDSSITPDKKTEPTPNSQKQHKPKQAVNYGKPLTHPPGHPDGSIKDRVRVFTWNILSPLCAPKHRYPDIHDNDLDGEKRLKRIFDKMEIEVQKKSIICLQEVQLPWKGKLLAWFHKRGYHCICGDYSYEKLGGALAYPMDHFELLQVDCVKVGSLLEKYCDKSKLEAFIKVQQPSVASEMCLPVKTLVKDAVTWIQKKVLCQDVNSRRADKPFEPYSEAKRKDHQLIVAKFRGPENIEFVVATYHMPCFFGKDEKVKVVNIHLILIRIFLQEWSAKAPFFFVGDFNIKPTSIPYKYCICKNVDGSLTKEGSWPEKLLKQCFKSGFQKMATKPVPMESAYLKDKGKEPEYTNIGAGGKIDWKMLFIDTLDYILYSASRNVSIVSMDEMPSRRNLPKGVLLPNLSMPSDHLPMGGVFKLPPCQTASFREGQSVRAKVWSSGIVVKTNVESGTIEIRFADKSLGTQVVPVSQVVHPKKPAAKSKKNGGKEKKEKVKIGSTVSVEVVSSDDAFTDLLVDYCLHDFYRQARNVPGQVVEMSELVGSARVLRRLRSQCSKLQESLSTGSHTTIEIDSLYNGIDYVCVITNACVVAHFCLKDFKSKNSSLEIEPASETRAYSRLYRMCESARQKFVAGETEYTIELDSLIGEASYENTFTVEKFLELCVFETK